MNKLILFVCVSVVMLIGQHVCGLKLSLEQQNAEALVNQINSNPKSTFQATLYPRFANGIPKFAKNKKPLVNIKEIKQLETRDIPVPPSYDLRQVWPQCIGGIQEEGDCGAVWAMVPSATISDRMCIKSETAFQERLSTQYILNCDDNDQGCNGGNLDTEFNFQINVGTPTESCYPYVGSNQTLAVCPKWCNNGDPLVIYRIRSVSNITGEYAMQQEILHRGSIMSVIDVYSDFFYYSKGVYQHGPNLKPYDHFLVRIIGWGSLNGVKYWVVPNIFGTRYGMNGYMYILRGVNEIGIEKNVYVFNV